MAEKLNWGVMGNANIARVCVIPAIQKSRNGVVRALASRTPDKAAEVVQKNHIDQLYDDYNDLIDDSAIEAIYIPLPNHLHCRWSLAALSAGKHVLCEKPLACNAGEAKEMMMAAQQADRLLMEAFMYRFHPRSREVHRLVQSGRIGPARLVRSAFCYRMAEPDYENPDNARLRKDMGGGALLDVGCYGVSIARWLLNAEPIRVQCHADYHPGGIDVHTAGILTFEGHRFATVEASMIAGLQQTYSVVGENGVIDLPHDAFVPWEKDALYTLRENDADSAAPTVVPGADEYQLMVEHFADAVRAGGPLEFSTKDSIDNMYVLDALAEAARTGRSVAL